MGTNLAIFLIVDIGFEVINSLFILKISLPVLAVI